MYYLVDERTMTILNDFDYTNNGISPYRLAAEYLQDCSVDEDLYPHRVSESVGDTSGTICIDNYGLYSVAAYGRTVFELSNGVKRDEHATEMMRKWYAKFESEV